MVIEDFFRDINYDSVMVYGDRGYIERDIEFIIVFMVYGDSGHIQRDGEFIIVLMVYGDRGSIQSEKVYNSFNGI
jgi:hypothetical protein